VAGLLHRTGHEPTHGVLLRCTAAATCNAASS
jgi:hypothetical protein